MPYSPEFVIAPDALLLPIYLRCVSRSLIYYRYREPPRRLLPFVVFCIFIIRFGLLHLIGGLLNILLARTMFLKFILCLSLRCGGESLTIVERIICRIDYRNNISLMNYRTFIYTQKNDLPRRFR